MKVVQGPPSICKVVLGMLVCLTISCKKDSGWKSQAFVTQDLTSTAMDVELPAELWQKITGVLTAPEGAKAAEPKPAGPSTVTMMESTLPTEFEPLKVFLVERNRGILKRGNTEIQFGPGGGELDLNDFVQDRNGSFYFIVQFMSDAPVSQLKVFYLSNALQRSRGADRLGVGCNKYLDITSAFTNAMKAEGFLMNTTDFAHVSALAGTFFFAAAHERKLHLAQLTIKDSSRRSLHCHR